MVQKLTIKRKQNIKEAKYAVVFIYLTVKYPTIYIFFTGHWRANRKRIASAYNRMNSKHILKVGRK
jgi:hypothetical protein